MGLEEASAKIRFFSGTVSQPGDQVYEIQAQFSWGSEKTLMLRFSSSRKYAGLVPAQPHSSVGGFQRRKIENNLVIVLWCHKLISGFGAE